MRTACTLLLALALAGCGVDHSNVLTLSQLREPYVTVEVDAQKATLRLHAYECPTFTGTAMMNGQPLEQSEQGGTYPGLGLGKGLIPGITRECADVQWIVPTPLPDEPLTELEVFDDTGRVSFGVRNLGARRGVASPLPTTVSDLRWEGPVELTWTPSTDSFSVPDAITLEDGVSSVRLSGGAHKVSLVDGVMRFQMPPAPPDGEVATPHSGHLQFTLTHVVARIAHCEPAPRRCGAKVKLSDPVVRVPVTVW
jgi:hypothetical protein